MVVQPACASVAMVGFATGVGVVGGAASERPVAMRFQVLPPSVLLRYADVAVGKPVSGTSCAVAACAYRTVVAGSAVAPPANAIPPPSVASGPRPPPRK